MTFKVTYVEHLVHTFYVEADTKEEAEAKFNELANNGELDFSYGEIYDTETTMKEADK